MLSFVISKSSDIIKFLIPKIPNLEYLKGLIKNTKDIINYYYVFNSRSNY